MCKNEVADPGRGAERLSERFFGRGRRPDSNPCLRMRVLKDVACGPNVKTGASVPGYSGGFAASPNVFLSRGRRPDTNQCLRICVLKDVACGPNVKTGAGVPGYSGGFAASPNDFLAKADGRIRIHTFASVS